MRRRVVITGVGPICAIGIGADAFWAGLRQCRSGITALTRFDPAPFRSRIAGQVDDFVPRDFLDARQARRLDRYSQLAVAAARLALDDARLAPSVCLRESLGVYVGSALGGLAFAEEQHACYLEQGLGVVSPLLALSVFGGAAPCNIALAFDLRGPSVANANSCASGAIAIGEAFHLIRAGHTPAMLAGGVEAPLAPLTFGSFALIRALSTRNDTPESASRPFDRERDGFVMAEGAALLVLEEYKHARARGARAYAEVLGYGTTNDAHHMTAPRPDGTQAARAITLSLRDAGIPPSAIDYVNAHASSTPLGDAAEARALHLALGEHATGVPVSGTKGYYGHPLGASGALEAALAALALERGWLPPNLNLERADEGLGLPLIGGAGLACRPRWVLTTAFGFGGINASLVLGRAPGT